MLSRFGILMGHASQCGYRVVYMVRGKELGVVGWCEKNRGGGGVV